MVAVVSLLALLFLTNPSSPQPSFEQIAKQADAARVADRMEDAIELYSEGVGLRPSWSEGWWWLASLLYDQDRFSEAQPPLQRFIAIASKPAPAYAFLGLCEYETRDYEHALQHFQEWGRRGSPGTDELLDVAGFHWALLLTRRGQFVEALSMLAAKAQKRGDSPALTEAMGLASLRLRNLPEDYLPEKRESVWLAGKAAFYASVEDDLRADEYAAELLIHHGHEPNVHYFRGTLFSFQKDHDAAVKQYQQELQISPEHTAAMIELALFHVEDHRFTEGLALAQHAVTLDPRNARAHYVLGRGLLALGRAQESARQLEIARQLAPASAMIRFALARSYRTLGRSEDAARELAAFGSLKESASAPWERQKTTKQKQQGPSE
jgi:tetratricopeptide (TPR) repeat protein